MDHFYQDIDGWFDFENIYSEQVKIAKHGSVFVEVGAWLGKSTAYMATEIANSQKYIDFYVVDHWKGSDEDAHKNHPEIVRHGTVFDAFSKNLSRVSRYYRPMRMSSKEAAEQFQDNAVDFVFLDASHDYENVKADILAWLPKVKEDGFIGGHDYHQDWKGVVTAVDELLPTRKVIYPGSWLAIK